jgi:hypothetical protein
MWCRRELSKVGVMLGEILDETVGDMERLGHRITYPLSATLLKKATFKYDFHIQRNDRWYYVDSCDTPARWKKHKAATKKGGGQWRIIESKTAEVIAESKGA